MKGIHEVGLRSRIVRMRLLFQQIDGLWGYGRLQGPICLSDISRPDIEPSAPFQNWPKAHQVDVKCVPSRCVNSVVGGPTWNLPRSVAATIPADLYVCSDISVDKSVC